MEGNVLKLKEDDDDKNSIEVFNFVIFAIVFWAIVGLLVWYFKVIK